MKWHVNCRGIDEHGIPLVAVDGSQSIKAVDRRYLIEAAPDLLEALKGMMEWARRVKQLNPGNEIGIAHNAIMKAEGRE